MAYIPQSDAQMLAVMEQVARTAHHQLERGLRIDALRTLERMFALKAEYEQAQREKVRQ